MQSAKRVQICTVTALASGLFGGYLGSQISAAAHTAQCQNKPDAMRSALCQVQGFGAALWQGSTAGLWTGTILGAAFGGAISSEKRTIFQKEGKGDVSMPSDSVAEKISFVQLQSWAGEAGVREGEPTITQADAYALLRRSGLSEEAIDTAWQQLHSRYSQAKKVL